MNASRQPANHVHSGGVVTARQDGQPGSRRAVAGRWLRCGALVTGLAEKPERDMVVRVAQGSITEVRPWAGGRGVVGEVLDFAGATLVPGLVDAHVHLVFDAGVDHASTRRAVADADPDALEERAAEHALACLRGGVTTARDCGDRDFVAARVRDAVAAGRRVGPRILAAGPPVTIPRGHLNFCGGAVATGAGVGPALDRLHGQGVDLVKVMASGGRMTEESDTRRPQFTEAALADIVDGAHRRGLRVAAHAHGAEAIRYAVTAGVDTLEHCTWPFVDGAHQVVPEVVAQIVERRIPVVLTMAGVCRGLLPESAGLSPAVREAALASSPTGDLRTDFSWARDMHAAGARFVLASDAGVRLTRFDQFGQSIRCGMVALDLTASQAIGLATMQAAAALGVEETVGSIEPGKVADFVVLEGIMDDTTTRLGRIRQVWQGGCVVVEDDVVVTGQRVGARGERGRSR